MVNRSLVTYLTEGRRRGFELSFLKQKLHEGGFSETEIDEASAFLSGPPTEKTSLPQEQPLSPEKLSILKKLYYAFTKPHLVFEKTDNESTNLTFFFHECVLLLSFVLVSLASYVLIQGRVFPLDALLSLFIAQFTPSLIAGMIGVALVMLCIVVPLLTFLFAGILHLFVMLLKGEGKYRGTYKSLVYGTVSYALVLPLCIVFSFVSPLGQWLGGITATALAIWSLITTTKALATYHRFSQGKAFIVCILCGIFFALVISAVLLGTTLVNPRFFLR